MAGLDVMTAAPIEYRIGDSVLKLSPIRLADMGELIAYFRNRILEDARDTLAHLGDEVPETMRREIIEEARERAAAVSMTTLMAKVKEQDALQGIEVLMRMVYFSARRHMPGLTLEDVRNICTVEKMPEFTGALDAVHQVQQAAMGDSDRGEAQHRR